MMFNPTCSHCEDETALLEKNIALFKKTKMVLMANPIMWDYLPAFAKTFHIEDFHNITLGVDSADFINKVF
jgi:protein-disulfide isomerase